MNSFLNYGLPAVGALVIVLVACGVALSSARPRVNMTLVALAGALFLAYVEWELYKFDTTLRPVTARIEANLQNAPAHLQKISVIVDEYRGVVQCETFGSNAEGQARTGRAVYVGFIQATRQPSSRVYVEAKREGSGWEVYNPRVSMRLITPTELDDLMQRCLALPLSLPGKREEGSVEAAWAKPD